MSDTRQKDTARLEEIAEHGTRISNWLKTKSCNEFLEDPMLRDAVSMNLLVIGEAANALSEHINVQS